MQKLISFVSMRAATPLSAQNCDLLCEPQNWLVEDPQFILDAIANGEDVNAAPDGATSPLVKAIMLGPVEMVPPLLEAGADPNIADSNGTTALMAATNAPDSGIIPLLIGAGADVNAANARGETALHFATAGLNTSQYLPLLLIAGADINAVDAKGRTAFDIAEELMHFAKFPPVWAALEAAQQVCLAHRRHLEPTAALNGLGMI